MTRKSRKNITDRQIEILNIAQYIRTAEYVRLSVEDNDNKGNSIENQKLILDDYIAHNSDMRLVDVYIDNGATGTNFQRPEFQRMIDDVEKGKIDCVIVKDLSRLGRNSIDTGFYIDRYFPEKKVRFIAVNDNFDTEALSNGDEMLLYIKNIINEAYALDIGKKIKTQARQAMRDGQYVSARPKYGYLKDPNDCHKLIVNPETAPVVRLIFELFNGGTAMNEICLQLNERQIPTPSVYGYQKGYITSKKSIGNGLWQTMTIRQILTHEIYTGKLVQGRSDSVAKKQTAVDKDKWIIVPNTHEAIISQEMFDKAQERIEQLKNKHKNLSVTPYTENIWKGKIFCGECGRPLHRQRQKRVKTGYAYSLMCLTNTRYKRGGCDNGSIHEKDLLNVDITSIKAQDSVLADRKNLIFHSLTDKKRIEEHQAQLKDLRAYIAKNQNFLNSLYENLVNGVISQEEYHAMRIDYGDKISDTVKRIKEVETKQTELEKQYNQYCDLSDAVSSIIKNNTLTKELINKLIERIDIYKGKRVEITYSFNNEYESEVSADEIHHSHLSEVIG